MTEPGCGTAVLKSLQNVLNFCLPASKAKKQPTLKVEAYDESHFTSPTDQAFNLKISSWNVAGLRAWLKKDGLRFVEFEQPDIFCLQVCSTINIKSANQVFNMPNVFTLRKQNALMISYRRRWSVCPATIRIGYACPAGMQASPSTAK